GWGGGWPWSVSRATQDDEVAVRVDLGGAGGGNADRGALRLDPRRPREGSARFEQLSRVDVGEVDAGRGVVDRPLGLSGMVHGASRARQLCGPQLSDLGDGDE